MSSGLPGRQVRPGGWALRVGALIGAAGLLAAGVLGTLAALSPGKPRPFLDDRGRPVPGSISEKAFVGINGVRQGMFLKGRDRRDPVLLYLHGGIPDVFLTEARPSRLEELFTVAWWEQRGSGTSFDPAIGSDALTTELLIADTLAVTDYLRERFGQDRIYLMAHSGGTFIGPQVIARAPERYHAYIGVAQMVDQLESERLAYEYILVRFRALGDRAMVRRLEASPVTPSGTPPGYLALRDVAMHRLGIGTTHDMHSIASGLLLPSLTYPEYIQPVLCAPFVSSPVMLVVAPEDEMIHADCSVARYAFALMPGPKQWYGIAGGHFGLLYWPGGLFDEASRAQTESLERWL